MKNKKRSIRHKRLQKQRTTLRRVLILTSSLILFLFIGLVILINVTDSRNAIAAGPSNGDYRTAGSGNWNSVSTWQKYNNGAWNAATIAPVNTDKLITIETGHSITITSNLTADEIVVSSGGFLIINSGVILSVAKGPGEDLNVFGIVKNAGIISIVSGASCQFNSTGVYQHNFTTTPGTIPTAIWMAGSTCEIIGYTTNSSPPSGLQVFSNFTWNCPMQSDDIEFSGLLSNLSGDLSIISTGTKSIIGNNNNMTLTVGGNYIQSGGSFILNKSNNTTVFNLNGNYNQSGGTFVLTTKNSAVAVANITGNFNLNGGSFDALTNGSSSATLNLSGNLINTASSIGTSGGNSVLNIIFKKAGTQYYTASNNTVSGVVNYTVNSASFLELGNSIVSGSNFTVASGGAIGIGSKDGITVSGSLGNVQVTGLRSFDTGADFIYNGTLGQVTGSGLPSIVRNFKISNSANVSLTNPLSLTGVLTFLSGKIITGTHELYINNTSTASIVGYSSSDYVAGNLRRSISKSDPYDFPIGTVANYELINVDLSNATGFTSILAQFTNADPIAVSKPLTDVNVQGVTMQEMIRYGYWTLTPNAPLESGKYAVTVTARGQSNPSTGATYSLLNRPNSSLQWTSVGTHNASTQTVNGGAVTGSRSTMNVFGDFGMAYGELLQFTSNSILSGTAGQLNAVYKFPNICSNVDAWVKIVEMVGGVSLANIDDYSVGYNEGWQPFLNVPANSTSYITWEMKMKVHNTTTDTTLPGMAMTAIDIDGSPNIKEFVEALMPFSYSTKPGSSLTVANSNGWYNATSNNTTVSDIDTTEQQAMFQIKYQNINSFYYRTGIINSTNSSTTRQTSLYFKAFLSGNQALPIKLVYFHTKLKDNKVNLAWSTASEINNAFFNIERSADGENFESINLQRGAGNSTVTLFYSAEDNSPMNGYSFYRLKQTDYDGHYSYSDVETVKNGDAPELAGIEIKTVSPNPFSENLKMDFISKTSEPVNIVMINTSGQIVFQNQIHSNEGYNSFDFPDVAMLSRGIYFVSLTAGEFKLTQKVIKN